MKSKLVLNGNFEVFTDGSILRIKDGEKVPAEIKYMGREKKYKIVNLYLKEKKKTEFFYIHRLVAEAFIPNPDNKPQVNHINGNSHDNRVENLRWVTASESTRHAYENEFINIAKNMQPCIVCGQPTRANDRICKNCKPFVISEANNLKRNNKIANELSNIKEERLSASERQAVELRRQGLTYQEIAEIFGVTKQCVQMKVANAIEKSSGNVSKKEYARLARELYKKEIKKEQLINKLEIIKQEISQIQEKLDIMNDSN